MPPESGSRNQRCVLLDRDGTINFDRGYLSHPDQLELLPNAAEGLRVLSQLGLPLIVVTNQSGIGRGFFDEPALKAVHEKLKDLLAAEGIQLRAIYHCPHHADDHCDCRKPAPGMVRRASADLGFDPARAFMIGDRMCDFELGRAVGAMTILVRGPGNDWRSPAPGFVGHEGGPAANFVVDHLGEAADAIREILKIEEEQNPPCRVPAVLCSQEAAR